MPSRPKTPREWDAFNWRRKINERRSDLRDPMWDLINSCVPRGGNVMQQRKGTCPNPKSMWGDHAITDAVLAHKARHSAMEKFEHAHKQQIKELQSRQRKLQELKRRERVRKEKMDKYSRKVERQRTRVDNRRTEADEWNAFLETVSESNNIVPHVVPKYPRILPQIPLPRAFKLTWGNPSKWSRDHPKKFLEQAAILVCKQLAGSGLSKPPMLQGMTLCGCVIDRSWRRPGQREKKPDLSILLEDHDGRAHWFWFDLGVVCGEDEDSWVGRWGGTLRRAGVASDGKVKEMLLQKHSKYFLAAGTFDATYGGTVAALSATSSAAGPIERVALYLGIPTVKQKRQVLERYEVEREFSGFE